MTALLNHLWQSSLFALAAGLLTLPLKCNPARVRYWLWFAASVKFLIPFALLVDVGNRIEWRKAPAIVQPAVYLPLEQVFIAPTLVLRAPEVAPHPSNYWPILLLAAWLCGFLAVLFSWSRQWLRIRKALGAAEPYDAPLPIRTMVSPALLEPGVFGVLRPVLVLPDGIAERLRPDQLEAIVAHELCHARSRDNLTAAVHMLVEAIFWFHPFVWWIGKRLVDERERACDEEVLLSGSRPEVYAESILKVCEFYLESPLDCVSGITGSDLRKRIRNIMTNRASRELSSGRKLLLAIAGLAAVMVPVMIGVLNAPQIRAQSQAAALPAFEVASVKPAGEGDGGMKSAEGKGSGFRFGLEHRRLNVRLNLYGLIVNAYALRGCPPFGEVAGCNLLSGGPDWLRKDRFEIVAKVPDNAPDYTSTQFVNLHAPQVQLMLQALLADRFALKIHREKKELPVYALTIGKKGVKFKKSDGSKEPRLMFRGWSAPDGLRMIKLIVENGSMQELADLYAKFMDRPLVDKTGLQDRYDFTVDYEANPETPSPFSQLSGPALFKAFEEQAGLKLEATKGPVEILVIDHAEKPSAN
jgi:bla regulator protein BlaR1